MTLKQGWKIFDESPYFTHYWEDEASKSGLLLVICARCGERQTRETYQQGFSTEFFTLIQDYVITAIEKHRCGQWHRVIS